MKTLYDLLGVERDASLEQIEGGFRQSLDAHRVRSGEPEHKKQVHLHAMTAAYRVLSSPSRRQRYDEKLLEHKQEIYSSDEKISIPWGKLVFSLILMLAIGGSYFYDRLAFKTISFKKEELKQERRDKKVADSRPAQKSNFSIPTQAPNRIEWTNK